MNQHNDLPGKGVMYWEEEAARKGEKSPDYKGFLLLEMDYKAGEKLKIAAWERKTSRGYNLLSLSEDNWSKKQRQAQQADKEVPPRYSTVQHRRNRDEDVPF